MVSTCNKYKNKHEQSNITLAIVLCIPCVFAFQMSIFMEINLQQSVKSNEAMKVYLLVEKWRMLRADADSVGTMQKRSSCFVFINTSANITNITALQVSENTCVWACGERTL